MFAVGKIVTTHVQWTIGEFTYAYMRMAQAAQKQDYRITHPDRSGFRLYLPPASIPLTIRFADPVPIRLVVSHGIDLLPQDMTVGGFGAVTKTILHAAMKDLANRCPRTQNCLCDMREGRRELTTPLGCRGVGRTEFQIEGMIA